MRRKLPSSASRGPPSIASRQTVIGAEVDGDLLPRQGQDSPDPSTLIIHEIEPLAFGWFIYKTLSQEDHQPNIYNRGRRVSQGIP